MTISTRRFVPAVLVLSLVASSAFAALSPAHADFAKGPAQWLMTGEEKSAWRSVSTDEQAERFIQLFWARRDPTPGTPRNEFREEFDRRVAEADAAYGKKGRRGSLTDHGRVFIVLGPPQNFTTKAENKLQQSVDVAAVGMADMATVDRFEYSTAKQRELGLTENPRFVENQSTHEFALDFQHSNIAGALAAAAKRAVVSPNLNEVPEWAKPQARAAVLTAPAATTPGAADKYTTTEQTSSGTVKKTTTIVNANVPVATEPAGANLLVLTKDVFAIDSQAAKNPLASMTSNAAFAKQDDLGFAAQYCAGVYSASAPTLREQVTITGAGADGKRVRMTGAEEEVTPDALKSMPGCYVVRGSLPLADVDPGAYKLTIRLTNPASGQSYTLDRDFNVQ